MEYTGLNNIFAQFAYLSVWWPVLTGLVCLVYLTKKRMTAPQGYLLQKCLRCLKTDHDEEHRSSSSRMKCLKSKNPMSGTKGLKDGTEALIVSAQVSLNTKSTVGEVCHSRQGPSCRLPQWKKPLKLVENSRAPVGLPVPGRRAAAGKPYNHSGVWQGTENHSCDSLAIPSGWQHQEERAHKTKKYQGLKKQLELMWKLKFKVVPVIMGALGAVTQSCSRFQEQHLDVRAPCGRVQSWGEREILHIYVWADEWHGRGSRVFRKINGWQLNRNQKNESENVGNSRS